MDKKWYHSSDGSGNLSLTVRGAIVAIVPIVVAILSSQGIQVDQNVIIDFVDSIFAVIAAAMIAFGLGRKVYYKLKGE